MIKFHLSFLKIKYKHTMVCCQPIPFIASNLYKILFSKLWLPDTYWHQALCNTSCGSNCLTISHLKVRSHRAQRQQLFCRNKVKMFILCGSSCIAFTGCYHTAAQIGSKSIYLRQHCCSHNSVNTHIKSSMTHLLRPKKPCRCRTVWKDLKGYMEDQ